MMFLAAFLGCLVAFVVYFPLRDVVSSIIWKIRFGRKFETGGLIPTSSPAVFQMLNADHDLRVAILDLTPEPNPELEAEILRKARAWGLLVAPDAAERMRNFRPDCAVE